MSLNIETGLSEIRATSSGLQTPQQRFAYFPHINTTYTPLLDLKTSPGQYCQKTNLPCESFPESYIRRMEHFAAMLEQSYYGKNVVLFSHAASVALVCALVKCTLRGLKFAPCGVYHLERLNRGPWRIIKSGSTNESYVTKNSEWTFPWGYQDNNFAKVD